jgi:hypothetical protein
MAYGDLTNEQKVQLQEWLQFVRPVQGAFSRLVNDMEVAKAGHSMP